MKKTILLILLSFTVSCVMAIPAKRGLWKTIRLANGTEIKAELRGDEYCGYWQAEDGSIYVKNVEKDFFEPTDMGTVARRAKANRDGANTNSLYRQPSMKVTPGQPHAPYTGEKRGIIILVQFQDKSFRPEHDVDLYDQIANADNFTNEMGFRGSVKDYFRDQSYGKFVIDFDVVGPVTMPENYDFYGSNRTGSTFNAMNVGQMVKDACMAVDSEVDFTDYDWDGDGEVDQVFILYAGRGEASGGDENTIWPHEWNLESAMATIHGLGERLPVDGVYVNTYACSCELATDTRIDGIGTICHEFSHCLGLPDMYDTSEYGNNYGMNMWDLMDQGSYNGDSFIPAAYTSFERWYAGWIEPEELSANQQIDNMPGLNEGSGKAYVIYNDGDRNEYFLLENRQLTGWDAAIPNSGLLITHVDFDAGLWAKNEVNSSSRQRCTVVLADNNDEFTPAGMRSMTSIRGDIYPSSRNGNNTFSNTSSPAAEVYNANTDNSYLLNKAVENITRNNDGTISFTFVSDGTTEIEGITIPDDLNPSSDHRVYTIDGRYVGSDVSRLPKGLYIRGGEKFVKR